MSVIVYTTIDGSGVTIESEKGRVRLHWNTATSVAERVMMLAHAHTAQATVNEINDRETGDVRRPHPDNIEEKK